MCSLIPAAGEATITHAPRRGPSTGTSTSRGAGSASATKKDWSGTRAKKKIRCYAKANGLDRLATCTYREEPSARGDVARDVRRFLERFQARFGRRPIAVAIELGEKNGRLHIHVALNFYVPKPVLERLWGHGFVDIRKFRGRAGRARAGDVGKYLAKYVAKELAGAAEEGPKQRAQGEHRYQLTQGWTPVTWRMRFYRVGQAYERLLGLYGKPDAQVSFGDWAEDFIYGIWYSFPASCWHPNRPP